MQYRVVSSDSHVIEPHDLWQKRVAAKYRDMAPKLVRGAETDYLTCHDADLPPVGLLAGCARGDDEVRHNGRWEEDVFVGGYDPKVRLGDLDRDGIDAEVLYPTIGMQLYQINDLEFQSALFRAYNDWLAEEMCNPLPERFVGIAMVSSDDVDGAIAETERARQIGLGGIMLPLYAGEQSAYGARAFDRLWAVASECRMPVSFHAATTRDKSKTWDKGTPTDHVMRYEHAPRVILDMVLTGVFDRYPDLKIVSAENDAGWLGTVSERADFWWRRGTSVMKMRDDICKQKPSTYIRDNVRVTFMRDHTAVLSASVFGPETLMWGNDFPHHVSTWPHSQKVIEEHFADQPADLKAKVVRDNCLDLYRFGR